MPAVVDLTPTQKEIMEAGGHLLITGGPGSGKTTVSILKAAKIARESLPAESRVLFLSFARATVSRVLEAIDEERQISAAEKKRIEVDTYHSFFWRILKAHGYLVGLPRRLYLLTPPSEAVALSAIRSGYKAASKLSDAQKAEKLQRENEERSRLAHEEGRVCFDLFASFVGKLLHGSDRLRKLLATVSPFIILDEFQDTNASQWHVVRALGLHSTLIALADPEQRIFDFIGADPARLGHFRDDFEPREFDLKAENHRSKGTDITLFGNDVLKGKFAANTYNGIEVCTFPSNPNQAYTVLTTQTLQARKRLLAHGPKNWSLGVLVPTKKMTRQVSDNFRTPLGTLPRITHSAAVDMDAPILAAEIVAFLMQPSADHAHLRDFVELLCSYFHGKGGAAPSQTSLKEAKGIRSAYEKTVCAAGAGKPTLKKSIFVTITSVYQAARMLSMTGNPDSDWLAVRDVLYKGMCPRLKEIANEVRNVRLLERGTQLRQALSQDWRDNGAYPNALAITRQAFIQEHFATAHRAETGIVVMNMHKAKGKQFDEVIIFEGWPFLRKGVIMSNTDRIVRANSRDQNLSQARQNFRVSITRAKRRTTILTPKDDPCVLLLEE
ncbi:MAG: UvrD/REP helicase [Bryobacterales bacterium]|nr:UvrD/REP helicase [Bryobacterales bacterium]